MALPSLNSSERVRPLVILNFLALKIPSWRRFLIAWGCRTWDRPLNLLIVNMGVKKLTPSTKPLNLLLVKFMVLRLIKSRLRKPFRTRVVIFLVKLIRRGG